jgi:hypothetical protein
VLNAELATQQLESQAIAGAIDQSTLRRAQELSQQIESRLQAAQKVRELDQSSSLALAQTEAETIAAAEKLLQQ